MQSTVDEDPLLINPCECEPADHLEWVIDWDQAIPLWDAETIAPSVAPMKIDHDEDDPYAKASIAIYGLNRAGLYKERLERLREMQMTCQSIVDAVEDLAQENLTAARQSQLGKRLQRYKKNLYSYKDPKKPYSAMATIFIEVFERELRKLRASP